MKEAMCHYSFHRRYTEENWDLSRLAAEVKALGMPAVDFHVRYLGDPTDAKPRIEKALADNGLVLAGLSMSNDFGVDGETALREQVEAVKTWLRVAAEVQVPVSRIFGSNPKPADDEGRKQVTGRVLRCLEEVVEEAEKVGVVLGLENHGGVPALAEEQVALITAINSPSLKATIDIGNYLHAGQEPEKGTKIAVKTVAYVHIKDYRKVPDTSSPQGWTVEAASVGEGDVNVPACLKVLKEAGYDGFIGLEYEGLEDERTGVPKSVSYLRKCLKEL